MIDWRIPTTTLALFAVAACAPSGDKQKDQNSPIGYELALADSADFTAAAQITDLSVDDLSAKLEAGNIRLIDVRTDGEVAEGMIPGAEHIALDQFDPASLDLSDGREIVLYCRSGKRSGRAGEKLAAHTGEAAQHLAGGITAWQAAGMPVT